MKDEIKEILYVLKDIVIGKATRLTCREADKLLDYITNLQEENKDNLKCIKSLKEQLESVINENQKLLETWHKNNDKNINLISENECLKETNEEHRRINGELRKTINKAIEKCINKQYETNAPWLIKFAKDIENILQGSDE